MNLKWLCRNAHRPHGYCLEGDAGATIVKAGLINFDPLVAGRVVDFDPRLNFLAGFFIVNHDVAGKQLGHAGGVVLNDKLLQFNRKWQLLQQHAARLVQDGDAGLRTFSHQQVGAKRRVAVAQTVPGRHIGNQPAAGIG